MVKRIDQLLQEKEADLRKSEVHGGAESRSYRHHHDAKHRWAKYHDKRKLEIMPQAQMHCVA